MTLKNSKTGMASLICAALLSAGAIATIMLSPEGEFSYTAFSLLSGFVASAFTLTLLLFPLFLLCAGLKRFMTSPLQGKGQ